jgi:hypothetical protein
MKDNELIGPVPDDPTEALANWRSVRERIHARFDAAKSESERATLLELYCALMSLAEKAIAPPDLEKFREIRGHGYSLLVVKECLSGEQLSLPRANAVIARETTAGRMPGNHVLRDRKQLIKLAREYVRTRQIARQHAEEHEGMLARILSWLHR